jgi:hypothetical protein
MAADRRVTMNHGRIIADDKHVRAAEPVS